jgi:hypothetical protein
LAITLKHILSKFMSEIKRAFMGNSLEGESYVGKSTALERIRNIESIREKGIIIVPEYAVVGEFVSFPRATTTDLKKAIQRIVDLEKKRTEILSNGLARNKDGIVLFDRGPISCIAFEYAAQKAGFKGAALWMAEAFQRAIGDNKIIVPSGMINLTASNEIIQRRRSQNLKKGKGEIIEFLRDDEVIKSLNDAFIAFGDSLPEQLFLTLNTDNNDPDEVGAAVLQFIAGQSDEIEKFVPDFIAYAENLINRKI